MDQLSLLGCGAILGSGIGAAPQFGIWALLSFRMYPQIANRTEGLVNTMENLFHSAGGRVAPDWLDAALRWTRNPEHEETADAARLPDQTG